jgi:hypothetical protein
MLTAITTARTKIDFCSAAKKSFSKREKVNINASVSITLSASTKKALLSALENGREKICITLIPKPLSYFNFLSIN